MLVAGGQGNGRYRPRDAPDGAWRGRRSQPARVKGALQLHAQSGLKRNVSANFVGRGWAALTYFAAVPAYIGFLGIEAFGLLGLFLTIVALSMLLELGLSTTLNRELARHAEIGTSPAEARDLLRTLEYLYWGLAAAVGGLVAVASPFLATHWLDASSLSSQTLATALVLMGAALFVQWPFTLYSGGLMGLQRFVTLNVIVVVMMTVRNGGAILVLWLVSPTITAFFIWQAIATGAQTLLTAWALWAAMPRAQTRARFRRAQLVRTWRFAAAMTVNSILVVVLTQLDKVLLSNLLSLKAFGYYSVAALVANGFVFLILPIFQAMFPRLTELVAAEDEHALKRTYHRGCQLMAVVVLPLALVVAFFAPQILDLWIGDAATVENTKQLVSLLVVGTALNGLMNIPYALTLAYGWTRFALVLNSVAVAVLIPLLVIATRRYGATGAAALWVALNAGYLLIGIQVLHRRLIPSEKLRWYVQDVGFPLAAALVVVALSRLVLPDGSSDFLTLIWMVTTLLTSFLAAMAASSDLRPILARRLWNGR